MKTTLKRVALAAILLSAAACAPAENSLHSSWSDISAARSVAKVSNLKSLESPGFY